MKAIKITIIGSGYVGLVSAAGFARLGHAVTCCDINKEKIDAISQGHIPFYEPGLQELVQEGIASGNLYPTTDIASAIISAHVIFIAVGTPMSDTGEADLSAVYAVARTVAQTITKYTVLVTKSTVPITTGEEIEKILQAYGVHDICDVVSNPEFLREGSAVSDFLHPERIVIGAQSERAHSIMKELYASFRAQQVPVVYTDRKTAETIKYASNTFLAIKVSFINELARLCDKAGADVHGVAYGMGLDSRIGSQFLKPGPGFGGSCFPKDVTALTHIGDKYGVHMGLTQATLTSNALHKEYVVKQIETLLDGSVAGKRIAILGLAFKAGTDDVRSAPAIDIIHHLLISGASLCAYDPVAQNSMHAIFPDIEYAKDMYEAVFQADCMVILTEWETIVNADLQKIGSMMRQRICVDTRSVFSHQQLAQSMTRYWQMGSGMVEGNVHGTCAPAPSVIRQEI